MWEQLGWAVLAEFLRKSQIFAGVAVIQRLEKGRKLVTTPKGLIGVAGKCVLAVGRYLNVWASPQVCLGVPMTEEAMQEREVELQCFL